MQINLSSDNPDRFVLKADITKALVTIDKEYRIFVSDDLTAKEAYNVIGFLANQIVNLKQKLDAANSKLKELGHNESENDSADLQLPE